MSINRIYCGTQMLYSFLENGNGGNIGGDCDCNCDEAYNNGFQEGVNSVDCSQSYNDGYNKGYEDGQANCEGGTIETPLAQIGYSSEETNSILQKMVDICSTYGKYVNFDGIDAASMFSKYENNKPLSFVPVVNLENVTNLENFLNCQDTITFVPKMNTSKVENFYGCFYMCRSLQEMPDWDFTSAKSMMNCFRECNSLKTIILNAPNCVYFNELFQFASGMEHIEIDGSSAESFSEIFGWYGDPVPSVKYLVIKNLKCDWADDNGMCVCENITYNSIKDQIMWLADTNGEGSRTLKIHPNTLALLSEDDIAQAAAKNWNITA